MYPNIQCPSRLIVRVRRSRGVEKKLKLFLMVATLVARNANEAVVALTVGSGGVCSQAVGFVLVRLAGIWLQSP
jgi:hypothetical protein